MGDLSVVPVMPVVPVVIGHRGAPGYRPEHTLASYRLAVALGADAVEPDLVSTSDGVLVLRHENELSRTTDVASHPEFRSRRTSRTIDGRAQTGWFVEDFTLAEIKSLRVVERLPNVRPRNTRWDGRYEIATFDELLLLLSEESRRLGRGIGMYAELKSSSYFSSIGLPLEEAVLASLRDHGMDRRESGVHLLSFETANLRRLRADTSLPLIQLVDDTGAPADCQATGDPTTYDDLCTPAGLRAVARYADQLAVARPRLLRCAALVEDAHLAGLRVLCWTIRDDDPVAPGVVEAETRLLLEAGVDGLFADQPDTALLWREDWLAERLAGAAQPAVGAGAGGDVVGDVGADVGAGSSWGTRSQATR